MIQRHTMTEPSIEDMTLLEQTQELTEHVQRVIEFASPGDRGGDVLDGDATFVRAGFAFACRSPEERRHLLLGLRSSSEEIRRMVIGEALIGDARLCTFLEEWTSEAPLWE